MRRRSRRPHPSILFAIWASLIAAVAPTTAEAAGFGPPVVISGHDVALDPQVAISPNGRTAVLYRRDVSHGDRENYQLRVALGPSPDRLAAPTTLTVGWRASNWDARPQLVARPDGGFVICLPDVTHTKVGVVGCTVAPPNGRFGGLLIVRRASRKLLPEITPVVRPDSSTLLLLQRTAGRGKTAHRIASMVSITPDAHMTAEQPLTGIGDDTAIETNTPLVMISDGTVAVPAFIAGPDSRSFPAVRLLPAGADRLGPPVQISPEPFEYSFGLQAASTGLIATFLAPVAGSRSYDPDYQTRVVRQRPDGSWGPTLALPGDRTGGASGSVVELANGDLFGIATRLRFDPHDSDCFNPIAGAISAGPLGPSDGPATLATPLSTKGQIAEYADAASLADGTVIVAWENAAGFNGETRIEARIRPAGSSAFSSSQLFQRLTSNAGHVLAASGQHAAIGWIIQGSIPRLVVSTFRDAPPYATQSSLPRDPEAPCDE